MRWTSERLQYDLVRSQMYPVRSLILATALLITAAPLAAQSAPPGSNGKGTPAGNYDVRLLGRRDADQAVAANAAARQTAAATLRQLPGRLQAMGGALRRLQAAAPGATARFSPSTAAPEMVSGASHPLSPPAAGPGFEVVRAFLHAHKDLYALTDAEIDALHFLGESVSPSGLRMVRVEQRIDGRPVFQSESRFILDPQGRVWRSLGQLVPGTSLVPALTKPPALDAPEALVEAMKTVGIFLDAASLSTRNGNDAGTETEVVADDARIGGAVESELVYFPVSPGVLLPAWRQLTFTDGDSDWYTVVDAANGILLWRKDMREHASTEEARFSVYVQADGVTPADNPGPQSPNSATPGSGTQFPEIARTVVAMSAAQDLAASPDGWIPDGGDTTSGNNVDAYLDAVGGPGEVNVPDVGALDDDGRPVGNPDAGTRDRDFLGPSPRDFDYAPAPVGGNPDAGDDPTGAAYRRGAVTHLFYLSNWYHDQLYNLGFDEAAGNFQNTNFSGMGAGGDRVLAEAQDGSGTNNANFSTPPDGSSGRMQMYRFTLPSPDRDGDLDAEVVLHELTHGLSNRLIGNASGLIWSVGRGMGEGWSDFYALALLNGTNADDPDGQYPSGSYVTYQLAGLTDNYVYGIRRFPYSTDNALNPLTWADVDDVTTDYSGGLPISPLGVESAGALEVHNAGEVWAVSLWEVRSRVIADPAGANGDVPTGNHTMLQLVTDALKMTPSNPSFVDARDALIAADCLTNACANEQWIWEGFADRGLGYGAVAPLGQMGFSNRGNIGIGESFAVPHLDGAGFAVDDTSGNSNGAVDPGEAISLTVDVLNPWSGSAFDAAGVSATLTTSTLGVTLFDDTSSYGSIAAGASGSGDPFVFTVSPAAACGGSLHFTVETTSSLGTASFDVVLRVGTASGPGSPVIYSSTPALAIPDNDRRGTFDTLTIADDLEIADLDLRLDSVTHTYTGDLTILLRGPNGLGGDLVWLRGALFSAGNGDNFIDTVIDDESSNDLNQTTPAAAPFTGDWKPAFNSPVWNLFADPALFPDPVGLLSRYDGMSTQGDWQLFLADHFLGDVGTLDTWSLIVTPTAFTCSAVAPVVTVSGTKALSGPLTSGSTVTYTVVLTNDGNAVQPDNPGDELSDVLPPALTLLSASASSGTAVANLGSNTVTWNGSLAPAGGSVSITIEATVNPGFAGQVVANAATFFYDADVNGSNESSGTTDDPATVAGGDPTVFVVVPASALEIPTLSEVGLAALLLALAGAGLVLLRRRTA